MSATSQAPTGEQAYQEIQHLVERLNDPYTRLVPAR